MNEIQFKSRIVVIEKFKRREQKERRKEKEKHEE